MRERGGPGGSAAGDGGQRGLPVVTGTFVVSLMGISRPKEG